MTETATPTAAAVIAAAKAPRPKSLTPTKLGYAEHMTRNFVADVDAGVTLDDVLKPEFFAHVASRLVPWSHIEVRPEDEAFYAELLVTRVGHNWVRCEVLQHKALGELVEQVPETAGFEVKWGGPAKKHRVIRKSDGSVLQDGFATAAEGNGWIAEHLKSLR